MMRLLMTLSALISQRRAIAVSDDTINCSGSHALLVGILCRHADAQCAQQVLNMGLLNQPSIIITSAFYQNGVVLNKCPGIPAPFPAISIPSDWASTLLSDQVKLPSIPYIIQLSHAVYRFFYDTQKYPDPSLDPYNQCLRAMGVTVPVQNNTNFIKVTNIYSGVMTALVVHADSGVFVIFKGTDFGNAGDVATDADCQQVTDVSSYFGSTETSLGVHRGFYNGWKSLEPMVVSAINAQLTAAGTTNIYIMGHSLGAAMGAIAALRFNNPASNVQGTVSGVWLFGCPRIGNEGWQREYNKQLLSKTLRISNYADAVTRLPATTQICPGVPVPGTFTYRHIGRSALLCPLGYTSPNPGFVKWQLDDSGTSEQLDCTPPLPDLPDFSLKTHWLGAYTDAWRRATAILPNVDNSVVSAVIANTVCKECSGCFLSDLNKQVNVVARAGGPIMCSTDASCKVQSAWNAATQVGATNTRDYQLTSTCVNYMCTYIGSAPAVCPGP